MATAKSAEYGPVLEHFAAEDVAEESCYPFAPVFRCRVGGREAVIKRTRSTSASASAIAGWTTELAAHGVPVVWPLPTRVSNPVRIGEETWVAYPFVEGERYTGTPEQVELAGALLGRIHAATSTVTAPPFSWPDPDGESIAADQVGLRATLGAHAPEHVARLSELVALFPKEVLPIVRGAGLPSVSAVMDYKANNLVFGADGPVLIDPDNADYAPRLLDLALAALQFHIEHAEAPARMFDRDQWGRFMSGYGRFVELTSLERRLWPVAVEYMLSEFGVWSLVESDDWDDPREAGMLIDMASATVDRFPLPGP